MWRKVRADPPSHPAFYSRSLHDILHGPWGKTAAFSVLREERLLGEIAGPFAHGNHAILASLAAQDQKLMAFEAKVADGEVHKLSPSDPRGV